MPDHAADALNDLLDREYAALLKGDLDGVARLSDRRSAALAAMSELPLPERDAPILDALVRKAERNQRMLAAAARGVRLVTARLAVLRESVTGFRTYDASGKRAHGPCPPAQLRRRT